MTSSAVLAPSSPTAESPASGRAYPTTRTRAVFRHTLPGSTLQVYDDVDRSNLEKIDLDSMRRNELAERSFRASRYENKLPQHLRIASGTSGAEIRTAATERKMIRRTRRNDYRSHSRIAL